MFGKGSKIYSIVRSKCPRCQEGDFFENQNPYALKQMGKHKHHCEVCGQKFELETGFYYGGMILNYAAGVVIFICMWLIFYFLLPSVPIPWRLTAMCSAIILLFPLTFHLTRLVWINLFVKYDVNAVNKQ